MARDNPIGDFALGDHAEGADIWRETEQMMEDRERLRAGMLIVWRNANRPLRANCGVKNAVWRETSRPFRLALFGLGGEVRVETSGFVTGGFVAGGFVAGGFVTGSDDAAGVGVKMLSWPVVCHTRE